MTTEKHFFYFIFFIALVSNLFANNQNNDSSKNDISKNTNTIVTIAVRAHSGIEAANKKWSATINYLSNSVDGYTFKILPLVKFDELRDVVKNDKVEFVLTNPTAYIDLSINYGVGRIATLNNGRVKGGLKEFGGVVFTRAERDDINLLNDVVGKSIMGVNGEAFGGWRMSYYEFLKIGIDPFEDCSDVLFSPTNTQEGIVFEVLNKNVDVGTVRTGILEKMGANGEINLSDIKIIEPKIDDYPLLHTSVLYPEWPFGVLKNTDEELSKLVTIALLKIDVGSLAALEGGYTGWKVPLSYNKVLNMLKELKITPFGDYGEISFMQVLALYWKWIVLGFFLFLLLTSTLLHIRGLNKKLKNSYIEIEAKVEDRTIELTKINLQLLEEIKLRKSAENNLKEKILMLEKFNRIVIDREQRMIEIKKEINSLLKLSGLPVKYKSLKEINKKVENND